MNLGTSQTSSHHKGRDGGVIVGRHTSNPIWVSSAPNPESQTPARTWRRQHSVPNPLSQNGTLGYLGTNMGAHSTPQTPIFCTLEFLKPCFDLPERTQQVPLGSPGISKSALGISVCRRMGSKVPYLLLYCFQGNPRAPLGFIVGEQNKL